MYTVGRSRRCRSAVVIANAISSQSRRPIAIRRRSVPTGQRVDEKPQPTASGGPQVAILFAYGTLRRGAPMHGLLEGRTTWIGAASVAGRLVDLGAFPGLVPARSPHERVHGDLFEIAEADREALLDALDRYEGTSFERVQQRVDGADGPVIAWLYVYHGDLDGAKVVSSGDYLAAR
jgi:gamma-glutamylcyclotransferase (GGCT)/AIG2-like uncharacterized protein YtfP